jgi:hypothetical protein
MLYECLDCCWALDFIVFSVSIISLFRRRDLRVRTPTYFYTKYMHIGFLQSTGRALPFLFELKKKRSEGKNPYILL